MLKSLSASLLFCMSLISGVNAQKHVFINYSVEDGLANSQVRSLFQDSFGDLWIGTLGGVSQFDGEDFTNYSTSHGLVSNQINSISQLDNENIILGGIGGISIYNGLSFQSIEFPEEYSSAAVNKFVSSGDSIIVATEKGLAFLKGDQLSFSESSLFKNQNIKAVSLLEDGLLILTRKKLISWSFEGTEEITTSKFIADLYGTGKTAFMDLIIDKNGSIFISTSNLGLLELTDDKVNQLSTEEGLASNVLSRLRLDQDNNILVCTKNGFSHVMENSVNSFNDNNGLEVTDTRAIVQDRDGRVWIGTDGGGLYKFTGYAFTYFNRDEGLSSEIVMSICSNGHNHLSFGSYNEGISILENDIWSYYSGDEITNNRVWTSTADSSGNIWYGTSNGIDVISNGSVIHQFTPEDGLSYKKITSLHTDRFGKIWAGSKRGINRIDENGIKTYPNFEGERIRAIVEEADGSLLLGSSQGIWRMIGETFELLNWTSEISDPSVYCIEAKGGSVWFGTKEGLFRFKSGQVTQIELSENFNSNVVNFIESDPFGNFWVGTNYGLFSVDENLESKAFTIEDGLINPETNLNSSYSDDSKLWFGTSTALQCIDYSEVSKLTSIEPPIAKLQDVKLNLEQTDWSSLGANHFLNGSSVPESPEVSHRNNNFSFSFNSNSLDNPNNVLYQYMVDGYDTDWQPVTKSSSATYTNLPFKEFTFKVRAKRLGQNWGPTLHYPFSIKPPIWQTWWFMAIAALVAIYISYSVFKYRRKNLITALEKEKFEIKSKMLALEQQSLNSSMNRHFIFNALNSIQYYINRQDRLAANRYLSNFAKLIRKNLDSSQVNFTSLADELERLKLYLEIENMRFKDKFEYDIEVADNIDEEATEIPSMLLQPFLENSIWHGILPQDKKGEIKVIIEKNPIGQMEIRIKDNGIGINTSQAQKNGKASHISKGMNITSGRIELLQKITDEKVILIGPFELTDEKENVLGTQVTIKLPLEYNQ